MRPSIDSKDPSRLGYHIAQVVPSLTKENTNEYQELGGIFQAWGAYLARV